MLPFGKIRHMFWGLFEYCVVSITGERIECKLNMEKNWLGIMYFIHNFLFKLYAGLGFLVFPYPMSIYTAL